MINRFLLFIFTMYTLVLVVIALWSGIYATDIEYVHVVKGGDARLTCPVPHSNGKCQPLWVRYEDPVGYTQIYIGRCTNIFDTSSGLSSSDIRRYNLTQDSTSASLLITHVTEEDMRYNFTCENEPQREKLKQFKIRTYTPSCKSPDGVIDKFSQTNRYEVTLKCTIKTAAQLTWYTSDMSKISNKANEGDKTVLTTKLTMNETDNYSNYTCVATPPDVEGYPRTPASCSIVPLKLPPKVDIIPLVITVAVGDNATFSCRPRLTYPRNTYEWLINGKRLSERLNNEVDNDGSRLTIMKVTPHDNNSTIKCWATNEYGVKKGSKLASLYVYKHVSTVGFLWHLKFVALIA